MALKEQISALTTEVAALRSKAQLAIELEGEIQRLKDRMGMISLSKHSDTVAKSHIPYVPM